MKDISKLLIQEPPLQVLPSLAIAIGLNEAIVLQQLYYLLLNPSFGKRIAEEKWIFNTYEEWQANFFPFWSVDTIKRTFTKLAQMKVIKTCQPEGGISRRKYYTIDASVLSEISQQGKLPSSTGQVAIHDGSSCPVPITKTTSKTTSKDKVKGAFSMPGDQFKPRYPYPESEDEMIATLEEHEIEHRPEYDGDFFGSMTEAGWMIQGNPVFDWIATYQARLEITIPGRK